MRAHACRPPLPPTRPQEACDEAIACFKKLLSELEEPQHGEVMRGNGLKVEQLRVRGLACLRGAARAAHLDDRIRTPHPPKCTRPAHGTRGLANSAAPLTPRGAPAGPAGGAGACAGGGSLSPRPA